MLSVFRSKAFGFQSTLPRGERHSKESTMNLQGEFQSTLPRGERHLLSDAPIALIEISIHAPTRGATFQLPEVLSKGIYFNPRSHEGSDEHFRAKRSYCLKFQSTLPRGERLPMGGVLFLFT